ncbi:unnamed protein product [Spirodela intermedia]|uniref:Oligosaccharyltransferase complex subunit n=1 Tax=Spirodela intermedia TaxID=51605 RepID=A0ABN7EB47_SPIIN|nr:unnamed protein product [Spirodela intermedia]
MRSKSDYSSGGAAAAGVATSPASDLGSIDPVLLVLKVLPFSFLRPPRTRLRLPSLILPSPMTHTGPCHRRRPASRLPSRRVNGQYIIEGLSSGFMFVLGGIGIIVMDLALDRNRPKSVRVSFASFGIAAVVISYVMSTLFIRIKIPSYLY